MRAWPWVAGIGAAAIFFTLALIRHLSFHSAGYDLGFFDQVLWNASRGHGLRSTFIPYGFFGEHFEPALLLFVPLYRLVPSPVWLLGAQSLALGLAVVPLHALACKLLGATAAWVAVAAYLLQLGVARAVETDFHTEALAVPFVFLAVRFAMERRWPLFILCSAVPLLTKEDGALVAIALGALAFLLTRKAVSLASTVGAIVYGAVILLWAMPAFRGGAAGDLIGRYAYLGSTPSQVALHVLTKPWVWIGNLTDSPFPLALLAMLAAVGFLPILRPTALAAGMLPLVPALLSNDPYQAGLQLQYGLSAVPLLMIAALLGWNRVGLNVGGLILVAGAILTWVLMAPAVSGLATDLTGLSRIGAVNPILDRIPAGADVAASSELLPHVSERKGIWEFPNGFGVPWVVIDDSNRPSQQSLAAGYTAAQARLTQAGYKIDAESSGVTLWRLAP
jgi:uncharacterized membrane protein